MNLTTTLRGLPGIVVDAYLDAARVPLRLAARASGQADNESWAPLLRLEGVQATVETVVGSTLGDETLLIKGRLRQEKLDQLAKAVALETVAGSERRAAEREFGQRREQAEAQRAAAERRAQQREQQAEQQAEQRERTAAQRAARKKAGARQIKAAQDKAIAAEERDAKLESLQQETEALAATEQALDAAETVEVIDDTLAGTREARQTN